VLLFVNFICSFDLTVCCLALFSLSKKRHRSQTSATYSAATWPIQWIYYLFLGPRPFS